MHNTFIEKVRVITRAFGPAVCAVVSLGACGADDLAASDTSEDADPVAELEQHLVSCNNVDGTNAVMAGLAVAAAQELRRWQPTRDFVVFGTSGWSESSPGPQQAIKLTATGKAQCADGRCWNTQALLDLQYDQANDKVKFPGNVTLSPGALRSRLVAKLREQQTCESRPANGGNNCPVEEHTLAFQRSEPGGCDTNFFFKATQPNGQALRYPAQLKNKLQWVDMYNPYIGFQSAGAVVSIDPTLGLNSVNDRDFGDCFNGCLRVSIGNQAGSCCRCNGSTRSFTRSPWSSTTFLCR
jgi:hypothetical protein